MYWNRWIITFTAQKDGDLLLKTMFASATLVIEIPHKTGEL